MAIISPPDTSSIVSTILRDQFAQRDPRIQLLREKAQRDQEAEALRQKFFSSGVLNEPVQEPQIAAFPPSEMGTPNSEQFMPVPTGGTVERPPTEREMMSRFMQSLGHQLDPDTAGRMLTSMAELETRNREARMRLKTAEPYHAIKLDETGRVGMFNKQDGSWTIIEQGNPLVRFKTPDEVIAAESLGLLPKGAADKLLTMSRELEQQKAFGKAAGEQQATGVADPNNRGRFIPEYGPQGVSGYRLAPYDQLTMNLQGIPSKSRVVDMNRGVEVLPAEGDMDEEEDLKSVPAALRPYYEIAKAKNPSLTRPQLLDIASKQFRSDKREDSLTVYENQRGLVDFQKRNDKADLAEMNLTRMFVTLDRLSELSNKIMDPGLGGKFKAVLLTEGLRRLGLSADAQEIVSQATAIHGVVVRDILMEVGNLSLYDVQRAEEMLVKPTDNLTQAAVKIRVLKEFALLAKDLWAKYRQSYVRDGVRSKEVSSAVTAFLNDRIKLIEAANRQRAIEDELNKRRGGRRG